MKQNLDGVDRSLRFALGLWFLGPWKPVYAMEPLNWIIALLGWIALVESLFGWCGLRYLLIDKECSSNTKKKQ